MRSEDTPFVGGPLDGRVLPVLLGLSGHPPKTYEIPVPDGHGGTEAVHVYKRVQAGTTKRLGLHKGWKYEYDPHGTPGGGLKWPWSRPGAQGGPDGGDVRPPNG
ncbi:hypothetical protein [Streptomyces sp. NPDC051162]|uniref:hypothetical protein n=1 Tax=Streptomyces sp. NPDC051162 TaxID=3154747 RepID=UPI00343C1C38